MADFYTTPLGIAVLLVAQSLAVVAFVMISLLFLVYGDRKIWAAVQMRRGPNVVGLLFLLSLSSRLLPPYGVHLSYSSDSPSPVFVSDPPPFSSSSSLPPRNSPRFLSSTGCSGAEAPYLVSTAIVCYMVAQALSSNQYAGLKPKEE